MKTRIVRVTAADAGLLDRVDVDVFDAPIDPSRLCAYLAEPGHLMVLAMAREVVVGQARGIVLHQPDEPPQLYVDNLGVTSARHREGIATRLLAELMTWGREAGCVGAWVATEADNGPARTLYAGLGAREDLVAYYEFDLT